MQQINIDGRTGKYKQKILDYFKEHEGQWIRSIDLRLNLGYSKSTVGRKLRELVKEDKIISWQIARRDYIQYKLKE